MAVTQNVSKILVQNAMQRSLLKAVCTDSVIDVLETMIAGHVSSIPIVDDGDLLVGIVSLSDVAAVAAEKGDMQVSSIMTESPATVQADDAIEKAAQLMVRQQIHHVPVVRKDMTLLGIISAIDFVKMAADQRLVQTGGTN